MTQDKNKKLDVETSKRGKGRPRKNPKVDFPKTEEIENIILFETASQLNLENQNDLPFEEIAQN
jgi:hypothetical protein